MSLFCLSTIDQLGSSREDESPIFFFKVVFDLIITLDEVATVLDICATDRIRFYELTMFLKKPPLRYRQNCRLSLIMVSGVNDSNSHVSSLTNST